MVGKVFVNYRRDDERAMAARVRDRLAQAFGAANVFMDVDNLRPGQRFDKALAMALSKCDACLIVIGQHWLELLNARRQTGQPDFVLTEIHSALQRGVPIIPVLIDGAAMPTPDQLPDEIQKLAYFQAHSIRHEQFGRDADALLVSLGEGARPQAETVPMSPLAKVVALFGYSLLTLAVLASLGILSGEQPGVIDAALGIVVLAVGIATFWFVGRRWRWLKVIGALALATSASDWLEPIIKQEVTVYRAFCSPYDYEFWECTMKGGELNPNGSNRYQVDRINQTVFKFGSWLGGGYLFKKCAVSDRLNWSCHYNDDSAIVEMSNGRYKEIVLKDDPSGWTKKMAAKDGQISIWTWRWLYFKDAIRVMDITQTGKATRATKVGRPVVVFDDWWSVDYAKNVCIHAKSVLDEHKGLIKQFGCQGVTSCPELTTVNNACLLDPAGGFQDFKDQIIARLATNDNCHDIEVFTYAGPDSASSVTAPSKRERSQMLMFDFAPGSPSQDWSFGSGLSFIKDKGTAPEIADAICKIAKTQGARIAN